jgi:hypothetical protein
MDVVRALSPAEAAAFALTMYDGWENYNIDPGCAATDPFSIDHHMLAYSQCPATSQGE